MLERFRVGRYCRTVLFVSLIPLICELPVGAAETSKHPVLTGTLSILYGDGLSGSGVGTVALAGLVDSEGRRIPLRVESARISSDVGLTRLVGKRVRVTGSWSKGAEAGGEPILMVETMEALEGPEGLSPGTEVPSEAAPFVTILCRFPDVPGTPHASSWYEGLMGIQPTTSKNRGMDPYWREQSYNQTTLQGSVVLGWYDLPQPQSYYVPPGSQYPDFGRLVADCTAAADPVVFFPSFYGINLLFNGGVGCCGWGAESWTITLDGQTRPYGVVWQPPGLQNLVGMAHEMGHAFGDPHSDCGTWEKIGPQPCLRSDPVYGCIPVHDLAAYKDLYHGWIPSNRIYQSFDQGSRNVTIRLERLALPGVTAGSYLLAKIPIAGSATHFYSLEARRFAGYDLGLPGEAVIIQDVDTTRGDPAHIVDADGGSCSDEGAMWKVGERFVDGVHGLCFEVLSADATSFEVRIEHCPVNQAAAEVP